MRFHVKFEFGKPIQTADAQERVERDRLESGEGWGKRWGEEVSGVGWGTKGGVRLNALTRRTNSTPDY